MELLETSFELGSARGSGALWSDHRGITRAAICSNGANCPGEFVNQACIRLHPFNERLRLESQLRASVPGSSGPAIRTTRAHTSNRAAPSHQTASGYALPPARVP